jgi:O-antigen ligase
MNLIWFLYIGTIFSLILGEFGRFPFGGGGIAVSLTDIFVTSTLFFLLIWQINIKKVKVLPKGFLIMLIFPLVGLVSLGLNLNFLGGGYLVRYVLYLSFFLVSYLLVKSKLVASDQMLKIIVIASVVVAILGFLQLFFYPDLEPLTLFGFDPHKNRLVSTFLDPNFLGSFLNISLAISCYLWFKNKKRQYLFFCLILLIAIFLTFSRSAYLMLLVEISLISFIKSKKLFLLVVLVPILLYLAFPQFSQRINGAFSLDTSSLERLESWNKGITIFKEKPLWGVGFNNLRQITNEKDLVKVFSSNGGHAGSGVDSSIIFILATTGIIGLMTFLIGWVYLFSKSQDIELKTFFVIIFIALLINSQFINSLFYPVIMLNLFILAGIITANERPKHK